MPGDGVSDVALPAAPPPAAEGGARRRVRSGRCRRQVDGGTGHCDLPVAFWICGTMPVLSSKNLAFTAVPAAEVGDGEELARHRERVGRVVGALRPADRRAGDTGRKPFFTNSSWPAVLSTKSR